MQSKSINADDGEYGLTFNNEYAVSLDNDKASLTYNKNLNGFDIRVNSNYNLMSSIPDYGATIELVSTF